MTKKLLVLGLLSLLSRSLVSAEQATKPAKQDQAAVTREIDATAETTSATQTKESSSQQPVSTDNGEASESTQEKSYLKNFLTNCSPCEWGTKTKVVAGLTATAAIVWAVYRYGCRCCKATTKKVARATQ